MIDSDQNVVVLRLPAHRAAWFGRALDAYARVCRLVGAELLAVERGPRLRSYGELLGSGGDG